MRLDNQTLNYIHSTFMVNCMDCANQASGMSSFEQPCTDYNNMRDFLLMHVACIGPTLMGIITMRPPEVFYYTACMNV